MRRRGRSASEYFTRPREREGEYAFVAFAFFKRGAMMREKGCVGGGSSDTLFLFFERRGLVGTRFVGSRACV